MTTTKVYLVMYREFDGHLNMEKVFSSRKSAERYIKSLSENSQYYWPRTIFEMEVE